MLLSEIIAGGGEHYQIRCPSHAYLNFTYVFMYYLLPNCVEICFMF